jgi:DNA-binding response OmpR family regulator
MEMRRKVLIIDDEIDLSLLLQSYLNRKGYDVYVTHTIAEGLQKLEELNPSILFLDNNLPDGTGWQLAPEIAERHKEIFICLLSAFHPVQPDMPPHSNFLLIEKPISVTEIDKYFSAKNL